MLRNPADKPTNVVFMGMGEPLLNWPAVDTALTILNNPDGFGIGARHITVSTVGISRAWTLAKRPEQFRLAISLHAPTPARRLALMPIEKKYDLEAVLKAAAGVPQARHLRVRADRGKNDSDRTPTSWPSWPGGWAPWSTCCRCIPAAGRTCPRRRPPGSASSRTAAQQGSRRWCAAAAVSTSMRPAGSCGSRWPASSARTRRPGPQARPD